MYDTINFWLSSDKVNMIDLSETSKHLLNLSEQTKNDGQISLHGNLKNLNVNIRHQGISIKGSLAKYFLNDNFNTLTKSDTKRAIEQLSDELCLPISKAIVTRLDFAQNLLMKYPPEAYYIHLGDCLNYQRLLQPQSIYYQNGLRQKLFYNKIAEGKKKREILPMVWDGKNILRYEMRFLNRLSKQFNLPEVSAKTISDEHFYISLFDKWHQEYKNINKINQFNMNNTEIKTPKDFRKQLEIFAINQIGQDKIMQEIENLRHQKTFDTPEYYSRLKKEIRELCNEPNLTNEPELIKELNSKIENTKRYYR